MSSNFRVKMLMIVLFTVYAGCTFFMATMNLISLEMLFVEIMDCSILIVVFYVILYKISKVKNKSESSISK